MSYQEESSLEYVHPKEIYPKAELVSDDKTLQVPFPCVCGESVTYLGRTAEGTIALSTYRLLVTYQDSFLNIPLGLIEMIECRDIFFLHIYCKDARIIRCTFATNEACQEWYRRLGVALEPPQRMENMFAFAFYAWCLDGTGQHDGDESPGFQYGCGEDFSYSFGKDVDRMGFNLKGSWRISYWNEDYKASPTYPKYHIVPDCITEKDLESTASFRSSRRIPSVVWRDRNSGAVIARSSQPEVGWLGWRKSEDENLLQAITTACALDPGLDNKETNGNSLTNGSVVTNDDLDGESKVESVPPKKLLIIDARSYAAAVANRAKGGGCECPEYYPNCEILFMSLANIHSIRKSFQALRILCAGGADQPNWLSSLENTKWLMHISGLMKSAMIVVNAINLEGRPVLVHCSDGWDRTPQIVALAELMLDPYYRTFEGFQVLVEREWLDFGHKFGDRCGHGVNSEDSNERCPVFLQWLDCVHQLLLQFPCSFEFNEAFLVKLAHHTYSCLFGTFLCNSSRERHKASIKERTYSVWTLLCHKPWKMTNYLYSRNFNQVLRPSFHLRTIDLWSAVYLANTAPMTEVDTSGQALTNVGDTYTEEKKEQVLLPKTRSCDDIVAALEHTSSLTRTSSDPNLSSEMKYLLTQPEIPVQDKKVTDDPTLPSQGSDATLTEDVTLVENGDSKSASEDEACEDLHKAENSATESDTESGSVTILENGVNDDSAKAHGSTESLNSDHPLTNGEQQPNGTDLMVVDNRLDSSPVDNNICDTLGDAGQSIESSTDTLTEFSTETKSKLIINNDLYSRTLNNYGDTNIKLNGCLQDKNITELKEKELNRMKIDTFSSISTSTSDISDSHVNISLNEKFHFNGQSLKINDLTLSLTPVENGNIFKMSRASQVDYREASSRGSSVTDSETSTPNNSRTPSSTCPPTPSADCKMPEPRFCSEPRFCPGKATLARQLDVDGLTMLEDPAQARLHQMECEYQQRIIMLERQLQAAKTALYQYASGCNGRYVNDNKDEISSLPDSTGSGEMHSLGNGSTAASDISWEHVDERDARMTLWVPDHAVTHCAGCNGEFWVVRRKHHCRNCGKVFCGECTDYYVPIPQQHLLDPVRVCRICFKQLQALSPTTVLEVRAEALATPCS